MAPDEAVFIDMIVAAERVGAWLEVLRSGGSLQRREQAVRDLSRHVTQSQAYAEEARLAGAVDVLTALVSKTDDQVTLEAASKVIAACSGPMADSGQAREFTYKTDTGQQLKVHLREGSLSDGLGVRLWIAAHTLCRELVQKPDLVRGRAVLELGSGCGLCGIVAAQLGAQQVTLTDYDPETLQNAACNMMANRPCCQADAPGTSRHGSAVDHREGNDHAQSNGFGHDSPHEMATVASEQHGTDEDLNSEDEDLKDMWPPGGASAAIAPDSVQPRLPHVWNTGNMRVRFLDWAHAPHGDEPVRPGNAIPAKEPHAATDAPHGAADTPHEAADAPHGDADVPAILADDLGSAGVESAPLVDTLHISQEEQTSIQAGLPPVLHADEKFDVVIGSDLLYEAPHASMVAAAIAHRMTALGCAILALPVRDLELWDTFVSMAQLHGMEIESQNFRPEEGDEGLCSESQEYEGGFKLAYLSKTFSNSIAAACRH